MVHPMSEELSDMTQPPDDQLLESIESRAIELARGAGEILARYFSLGGGSLSVEFKDDRGRDPVTNADTEAQHFLTKGIAESFPNHGILGEEDDEDTDAENRSVPDFMWVLDPLDGTKNFLHGLPVYASSVGVMYRGEPVVGAVFTPWAGSASGVVHHARKGGGAYTDGEPIKALGLDSPGADQLITVPGAFDRLYRFGKPMRGRSGDPRVTGSIAYELVLVSRGVTQYMYTSNPHLWDIVGGVAVAMEAGAALMVGQRSSGPMGLFPSIAWRRSNSLVDEWRQGSATLRDLRRWARPLILGAPPVAELVSQNMAWRRDPMLRLRFWWMARKRRRG